MVYRRIWDLREDNDLTQQNMADRLGCSQRVYSNYECGDVQIPIPLLIEVAKFYGTSVDYLLELTDEKKPYPRVEEKKKTRL